MKTHHSYRKRSRPISLPDNHSQYGKSLAGPNAMQMLHLEENANQSSRVRRLAVLQQKTEGFLAQKAVFQMTKRNQGHNHSKFEPSQKAGIHVHSFSNTGKKLKGQLNFGGSHITIDSYFSALHALKTLQAHPETPGFDEMECLLKDWLDEFSPSTSNRVEDTPVKKKHEAKDGEKNTEEK